MKSATAIAFDYRPSRWLLVAILIVAALALLSIVLSGAPSWAKTGLCVVAAVWAGFALRRCLRPQIVRAAWQPGGHWRVVDGNGNENVAELHHAVARGAWIVLNLHHAGKRAALILGPDNCDADTRRRLRVRLAGTESQA
ncbi:MAG TPA: protein YgfX [Rudaea sp.]|jgi:toxin CptA